MFKYLAAMLLVFFLAPLAHAQSDQSLDIAGITLDMTIDEVRAAVSASGYKLKNIGGTQMGSSFEEAVEKRRKGEPDSKEPRSVISVLSFEKTDNPKEGVSVYFYAMPKGPAISKVSYINLSKTFSFDEVFPLVAAKYGEPLRKSRKSAVWVGQAVSNKNRIPKEVDRIEMRATSSFMLKLSRPSRQAAYSEAFLEALKANTGAAQPTF